MVILVIIMYMMIILIIQPHTSLNESSNVGVFHSKRVDSGGGGEVVGGDEDFIDRQEKHWCIVHMCTCSLMEHTAIYVCSFLALSKENKQFPKHLPLLKIMLEQSKGALFYSFLQLVQLLVLNIYF